MATFSKCLADQMHSRTCQGFMHSESCRKHLIKDITLYALSNFKYFAPICLLPALVKMRNLNKQKLRNTLEYYFNCSVVGTCIGYSIDVLICLIRHIRKQFGYYSFVFIPTLLGSNFILLGSNRVQNLFQTAIFQCNIETFFLMRKNIFSRTIANSVTLQTCLFMVCSAIILHGKQLYDVQGFWLLDANPKTNVTQSNDEQCGSKCYLHPQRTCKQYLIDGLRNYFILGLSLDVIKIITSQVISSKRTASSFINKLKEFRIRSMSLLAAYVGIYRFTNCWLNRQGWYSDTYHHILSSFLAGSAFYLYPQTTLFAFGLVQAVTTFWKIFKVESGDTKNKTLKLLLSIHFAKILFPFAVANLVHLTIMKPYSSSHLGATIANGLTNKYPVHIKRELELLKLNLQPLGNEGVLI